MRLIRYLWRVPLLLLHLLLAVPVAWLVQSDWAGRRQRRGEPLNQYLVRWWTRSMLRIIGVRPRQFGEPKPNPVMFVANHVSWLDIELMHSQRAVSFVAKAEIDRWPVIGWLSRHAGTIFHRRGSNESMNQVIERMTGRLQKGLAVAVFPEGSTGPAEQVRTFHARVLQAALVADAPIQPVALRYSRDGELCQAVCFGPGESFFANAWRVIGEPPMDAEVHFLPVLQNRDQGRKAMATTARERVAQALGLP